MTANPPKCSAVGVNGKSTYRRIAIKSSVDESLFGDRRSGLAASGSARLERKTNMKASPVKNVSISLKELERINKLTSPKPHELNEDEARHEQTKTIQTEAANTRKEHMKQLELNEIELQKTMGYQCDKAKLDRIRTQAQEKIDDEEDVVKLLKTYKERAMTFAIRDQQLKDKAEREKNEQDYEQRVILAMEIDRLQAIEAREVEEACRVKKMVDARKMIEDQIKKRHQDRLLSEEAKDEENREILAKIKTYQSQDEEKARARRDIAMKAQMDIIRANEEDIVLKRERSLIEQRENDMLVAYQLEQDEKMRQREEAVAEAERKRCLEFKIQQERMVDRRSEIDELRERRAFEERERKFRQKQLADAQKKKRDMDILDMARLQQHEEKLRLKQTEMEQKQEEYESTLAHSRTMAEREREEAEYQKKNNYELIQNLQQRLQENESKRNALQKEKLKEGLMIKQQQVEEREKLEAVRDKFVKDMKSKGIDERYFSEMTNLDIGHIFGV